MIGKWRIGHIVVTGLRDGERVALTHGKRVSYRITPRLDEMRLTLDHSVELRAELSGADARWEVHDDEMGLTVWASLIDNFTLGQTFTMDAGAI